MLLIQTQISDLRCIASAELSWAPGLNLITGSNGAGKTSLVEAVHLMGYGRSFRGRVRDGLIRSGATSLSVFHQWRDAAGRTRQAGLRHSGQSWEARLDGVAAPSLTELCAELAVVTFEPGSHELIAGCAELRRRFLDWALFHVEPGFIPVWRRYSRALKQRNALLKTGPRPAALDPWDRELAESGGSLSQLRSDYLCRLEPLFAAITQDFLSELGLAGLHYSPGWRRHDLTLADALLMGRDRDIQTGFTGVGPHRADWRVDYAALPGRETLSRGQEKLTALACVLAQARAFVEDRGEWPVVCLDDLASELDLAHQEKVLASCLGSGAQVLLTGTEMPPGLRAFPPPQNWFHVERGQITRP